MGRKVFFFSLSISLYFLFQNCGSDGVLRVGQDAQMSQTETPTPPDNTPKAFISSISSNSLNTNKPDIGTYCRVFDNASCQLASPNVQGTVVVSSTNIKLANENCASYPSSFDFVDPAVSYPAFKSNYFYLSRGIYGKCSLGANNLPLPATEMVEAHCTSAQDKIDVSIVKNLTNQSMSLDVTYLSATGIRSVKNNSVISKRQSGADLIYSSAQELFELTITPSQLQSAPGRLNIAIDNTPMSIILSCRYANVNTSLNVSKDLYLDSSWIDTSKLAGYWKLNDATAIENSQVADSSSHQSSGVLTTGADGLSKKGSGVLGGAFNFDGVNDTITVNDPANKHLDFYSRTFTYMVWVKVTSSAGNYDMPMWKGGGSAGTPGYDMELGLGNWGANIGDGTKIFNATFGAEASFLGRWVHLAVKVDRTLNRLYTYVDGTMVTATDITGLTDVVSPNPLKIGSSGTSYFFKGLFAELAIWDTGLTDAKILEIFKRGKPKFY